MVIRAPDGAKKLETISSTAFFSWTRHRNNNPMDGSRLLSTPNYITLYSLHRLICNAQNVSASALRLGPLWIVLKVDPPNPAGCDNQATS